MISLYNIGMIQQYYLFFPSCLLAYKMYIHSPYRIDEYSLEPITKIYRDPFSFRMSKISDFMGALMKTQIQ